MLHVVIDTSIYRSNPKRNKAAFRALTRLARGKKLQLHVPHYVKQEFISQQCSSITEAIKAIQASATVILRTTGHEELEAYAKTTSSNAAELLKDAAGLANNEFSDWLKECHAIECPVKPDHGQRVTDDYFSGAPPFTSAKRRQDIPDSFIWQTVLDLARQHNTLHVIANDEAIHKSANSGAGMVAYKTLEDFIQTPACQKALRELVEETVTANIERAQALLPTRQVHLAHMVEIDIVNALHGRNVHHSSIPDDNNEAMILSVGKPDDLTFDFKEVEYYGANELGVSFGASVECTLSYAIFKADYHTMSDEETQGISIDQLNDHYYDAEQDYPIEVKGVLTIKLDTEALKDDDLTENDISDLVDSADYDVEILETSVAVPYE